MPANQSLILAGESSPGTQLAALNGAALKRVTVFEARTATTVVVQSDYLMPENDAGSAPGGAVVATERTLSRSIYRNPVQLYQRTQRGLDEQPRTGRLDVLA